MTLDPQEVAALASQHNIPPAVVYALAHRDQTPIEDLDLGLLTSLFRQHGDWESALSAFKSGDPSVADNPNHPASGWVNSVLGIAGSRANYGMDHFQPTDQQAWQQYAGAFHDALGPLVELGGVVTPEIVSSFAQHLKTQKVPDAQQAQTPAGQKAAPEQHGPDPKDVREFIERAQPLGIDPEHFIENYPFAAMMSRKLMGKTMSLEQFAPLTGAPKDVIQAHINAQPHPVYPDITVGQYHAAYNAAMIHAPQIGRFPTSSEAHMFATAPNGVDHKIMAQYYQPLESKQEPQPQQKPNLKVVSNG